MFSLPYDLRRSLYPFYTNFAKAQLEHVDKPDFTFNGSKVQRILK